jgi:hypothetical protein
VLILAAAEGEEETRSVTWRGTLRAWSDERPPVSSPRSVDAADGEPGVDLDPIDEPRPRAGETDGDDDDPWEESEPAPDPVWVVIEDLRQLPLLERVHTNELVPKRDRGARFFVPRAPRTVRLPE